MFHMNIIETPRPRQTVCLAGRGDPLCEERTPMAPPPYGFLSKQTNPSGFDCSESVRMNTTSVP